MVFGGKKNNSKESVAAQPCSGDRCDEGNTSTSTNTITWKNERELVCSYNVSHVIPAASTWCSLT